MRWKAETTLGKKEVLGLNTTLSLCKTKKGSLQDKAASLDTRRRDGYKEKYLVRKNRERNVSGSNNDF